MSAIFGILRFDGANADRRELERMAGRMAHRGPDGRKLSVDGRIGLGHCLLRVNGEDLFEAQPIHDREADIWLVADCRIDNRDELAQAFGLGAEHCRDQPDSAFVLRAYRMWGEDAAEHLLGDFAFAIWDGRAQKLILSRDHMGQRYVHFHRGRDFFAFATEIPALWTMPDVPRAIDEIELGRALMHERRLRPGRTPFRDVAQLPAASTMVLSADGVQAVKCFWQVEAGREHLNRDEDYYVEAYRRVLGEAVGCRVRRLLRNPGLFLSGGYDSSAIAGLSGAALPPGRRMIAAASVMPEGYRGPLTQARRWADMCARHMPHLDVRYVTREGLNALSGADESYVAREMPAGSYDFAVGAMLQALAAAGVRLAMDGQGGDQTLNPRGVAGVAWFVANGRWRRAWRELRALRRHTGRPVWLGALRNVLYYLTPPEIKAIWARFHRGFRPIWFEHPINRRYARALLAKGDVEEARLVATPKNRLRMRDTQRLILRLMRDDTFRDVALLAAHRGMEFTQPFCDRRVVELGLALPEDLYFKNGRNRHLGRRALEEVYPKEFQDRVRSDDDIIPDFVDMMKAMEPQLRAELERLRPSRKLAGYFEFAQMNRLLDRSLSGRHRRARTRAAQIVLPSLLKARFIDWFLRDNR